MADYQPTGRVESASGRVIRDVRQLAMDEMSRSPQPGHSLKIDHAFPEKFVDELSRREVFNKHLFRPNTYLHKWWARRCGSMFRAILKQFVPDTERQDYYTPGGLEGKIVLDPMMGGGTTLHEAIRLGANVIGADIDPIPVVQARASLSQAATADLQAAFNRFHSSLYDSLGWYFQTECPTCQKVVDIQYTLYGLRKHCACREVVQIDQYDLREEADRKIRICPVSWEIYSSRGEDVVSDEDRRLITKAEKECPICEHEYEELLDLPFYARYVPIAISATCAEHGMFFTSPGETDLARIRAADNRREGLDLEPLEGFEIATGPKSGDLMKHGVRSYLDLFSSRQLLYLHHAAQELRDYDGVKKLNLGMLVSTSLEFNAMLCGYKGWYKRRPGAIRHVFALHAYSFPYTALENNPVNLSRSSGNLQLLFRDRIERGRKWAALPIERRIGEDGKSALVKILGEVDGGVEIFNQADLAGGRQKFWLIHGDSRKLPIADGSVDLVVTDPPYYDSVQYSDLAAFFRAWLPHLLPGEVEWAYDESHSAVATKQDDGSGFTSALSGIFAECGRVLKSGAGRMVFTFHHWDPSAWAELTIALKCAGFKLMNSYTVYSEHPISVHIRNLNSIKHDSILVFAHSDNGSSGKWEPLERIDTSDSETFCRQCGATLGWLLKGGFSEDEIREIWRGLIQDRTNRLNPATEEKGIGIRRLIHTRGEHAEKANDNHRRRCLRRALPGCRKA